MKPIPTNLITGFLGVGKTTALIDLLQTRPVGSRWAVIVNEYGEVGIDGVLLADRSQGVEIQEVAGGCVCCTSAMEFHFTLAQILEHVKPERILIETTGVGHPAKLLEELQRPNYASQINLRATIGLLTPSDFNCPPLFESPVFRDQIELADVLVLNKSDLAEPSLISKFLDWGESLFPPKLLVAITQQGRLDPAWLDLGADLHRKALYPEAHADHEEKQPSLLPAPLPGTPIRKESRGPGGSACGWIFSPRDIFQEERLLQFLSHDAEVLRLKGVFHTDSGWISINRAGQETITWFSSYRRDSRLEVFARNVHGGWSGYEKRLLQCLENSNLSSLE